MATHCDKCGKKLGFLESLGRFSLNLAGSPKLCRGCWNEMWGIKPKAKRFVLF